MKKGCLWTFATIGGLVVLGIVIAVAGGGSDSTSPSKAPVVSVAGSPATPTTQPSGNYKIGQAGQTSDLTATVYGFQDPYVSSNQFLHAHPGMHYVTVDVQIANPTGNQQTFSSGLGFHLVDSANRQYTETFTDASPPAPEGQIPAGGAVRGNVSFEVPDGTTGLRLRVQGSFTASGAYFTLS